MFLKALLEHLNIGGAQKDHGSQDTLQGAVQSAGRL